MKNSVFSPMLITLSLVACNPKPTPSNPAPGADSASAPDPATLKATTTASASGTSVPTGPSSPGEVQGQLHWDPPPPVSCTTPDSTHLGVPRFAQATNEWCWAAAGQMMMKFLGRDVSQCEQAGRQFGHVTCQCPRCPDDDFTLSPCNQGAFPAFEQWGFDAYGNKGELPLKQIKAELACRRSPIAFSWGSLESQGSAQRSGHMMVAIGYSADFIEVIDPEPGCFFDDGSAYSTFVDYGYYVNGDLPTKLSHWEDRYAVRLAGK